MIEQTRPSIARTRQTQARRPANQPGARRSAWRGPFVLAVALLVVTAFPILVVFGGYAYFQLFGLVMPGVHVEEVTLAGLTLEEASARLDRAWNIERTLIVTDGLRTWQTAPTDFGLRVDAKATAQNAFAVGRREGPFGGIAAALKSAWGGAPVAPVVSLNTDIARLALTAWATAIDVPSQEATLGYKDGSVKAVPGRSGYVIDVTATLVEMARDPAATLRQGFVPLNFAPLDPAIFDASSLVLEVEGLLATPVHIDAYDLVTQEHFTWTVPTEVAATWLTVVSNEGHPALGTDGAAIRAYLDALSESLGAERWLDGEAYIGSLAEALTKGHPATIIVSHAGAEAPGAERLLAAPLRVPGYDAIANEKFEWTASPEQIASWLVLRTTGDSSGVVIDEGRLAETLEAWDDVLGPERYLDPSDSATALMKALRNGADPTLIVRHKQTTYTVKPGDTLTKVGWAVGMPYWNLFELNPGMKEYGISNGQLLNVPSKDKMLQLPIVLGKRVVISISQQRMWIYEDDEMIHEWVISTGIDRSPTQPGVYQVQAHYENAYASIWDLTMPHFITIYEAWPGFENGIHGLPMLSNGRRLWADVLGRPASYGCIILGLEEAEWLFTWAEEGVVVEIQA